MSDEVVRSLNLYDLDDVDFLEEIERAFGVRFGKELLPFRTLGELCRTIELELPESGSAGSCATSMAFYRLRRAAQARMGVSPTPTTLLTDVLGNRPKQAACQLALESGLRIASPPLSWTGSIGCLLTLLSVVALAVSLFGWPQTFLAVPVAVLGVLLVRLDPGRYRHSTFGDFVRSVAHQNAGYLFQHGADSRPASIERSVLSIASMMSGIHESRIGLQTAIWPLPKKQAA